VSGSDEAAAHCPTCGAEYRAGFEVCADDGALLVPGPAPQSEPSSGRDRPVTPPPAGPPVRWVEVASFSREEEARLLAGRLEAEGVPARTYPEEPGDYYGAGTSAMLGQPIHVLVPELRVLEAREVIEGLRQE
jgi:hypothetical protein